MRRFVGNTPEKVSHLLALSTIFAITTAVISNHSFVLWYRRLLIRFMAHAVIAAHAEFIVPRGFPVQITWPAASCRRPFLRVNEEATMTLALANAAVRLRYAITPAPGVYRYLSDLGDPEIGRAYDEILRQARAAFPDLRIPSLARSISSLNWTHRTCVVSAETSISSIPKRSPKPSLRKKQMSDNILILNQ